MTPEKFEQGTKSSEIKFVCLLASPHKIDILKSSRNYGHGHIPYLLSHLAISSLALFEIEF